MNRGPNGTTAVRWGALFALVGCAALWTAQDVAGAFDPPRDGTLAVISLAEVVAADVGEAWLEKAGQTNHIVGLDRELPVGVDVSVGARFQPDGSWRAEWVEEHPGRAAKRRLGLVGTVVTAGLVVAVVRFRRGGLQLRG